MAGFIFVYIWNRSRVWENHTTRFSKGAVMDQKANLKIKTCWIVAQLLAHKLVNFASLTQSIIFKISSNFDLEYKHGKHKAFRARKVIGTF